MIMVFKANKWVPFDYLVRDEKSYCFVNDLAQINKGIPIQNTEALQQAILENFNEFCTFEGTLETFKELYPEYAI